MPSIDIYKNSQSSKVIDDMIRDDISGIGLESSANRGFLDRLSTAFDMQSRLTQFGNEDRLATKAEEQLEILNSMGVRDEDPSGLKAVGRLLGSGGGIVPHESDMDRAINELREREDEIARLRELNPNSDLRTVDELQQELGDEYRALALEDAKQTQHSTFMGKLGFAAGAIGGYFLSDPANLTALAIPGGVIKAGKPLQSARNVAAVEAGIDAALFAKDRPTEETVREAAGEEVTATDRLKDFFTSMAIAVGIAAPIGALLGKFSRNPEISHPSGTAQGDLPNTPTASNPVTASFSDKVDDLEFQSMTAKVDRQALTSARDMVDIAKTTPRELTQVEHAINMDKAYSDFLAGNNVEVPVTKGTEPNLAGEVAEEVPVDADVLAVEEIQTRTLDDVSDSLSKQDIEIELEGGVTVSAREHITELKEDLSAIDEIIKCHARGGPDAVQ
jgi:hypothetical protein